MAERVLVTGSAGFLGGYIVPELLARGYRVLGLDNFTKNGLVRNSYDGHSMYQAVMGEARDRHTIEALLDGCDHLIANAALVGGIGYFHARPYDLLAANERITAATADAAIRAHQRARLRKVTWISSSMVYESATTWPSAEGQEREMPPPRSSYGFQKLAVEYFARAAWDQYQLPYTIVRPFNAVGPGESPVDGMAHVVPDLVAKVMGGECPLTILGDGSQVRHYTYAGDVARGIVDAMASPDAWNEDFNLASSEGTTVLDLAALIWRKLRADPPAISPRRGYLNDVQRRVPDVGKARRLLGWEATTPLETVVDQVIEWMRSRAA